MPIVSVSAPPSKSLSHRALIAAACADGVSRLSHVLESQDLARTREALSALGAVFERLEPGVYKVTGTGGRIAPRAAAGGQIPDPLPVFVGESGTTCRLLTALLASGRGRFLIHGAGRMHERPIGELTGALEKLGARIEFTGRPGCPPLLLDARGLDASALPGKAVSIGCDESSQYLSGLLLAAPLARGGLSVLLGGGRVVSWPYTGLTLETMERFGVAFSVQRLSGGLWKEADWRGPGEARPGELRFIVPPGAYRATDLRVEGDWSGASYFLAAGAIGPKAVRVLGLNGRSLQGDAAILDILEKMGADVSREEGGVTVFPSRLRGADADLGHCPDLAPTVAALAAHAEGPTVIRNAAHLAAKESNRLEAPASELRKIGCRVLVTGDGLVITPPESGPAPPEPGALFSAHNDHRMAMSLALLGLPGTRGGPGFPVPLDDPDCVAKSFPDFWKLWSAVTA